MLRDEGGRFRTIRTDEEELEELGKFYDSLSNEEKEAALAILADIQNGGHSPVYDAISEGLYRIKPVSMQEFLENPLYLGDTHKSLFPQIKQNLIEMFSGRYNIVFLGGSLGAAKTTQGVIAMVRMAYELSCLKNPQLAYGISPADKIIIPGVSVTEDLADRNIIDKCRSMVDSSPYFNNYYKPIRSTAGSGIVFQNGVMIPPGASTESGALGGNAIGAFIDESNFFRNTNVGRNTQGLDQRKSNIQRIYEAIKRRIESRFMNKGRLPGLLVVASSKTHDEAFTEREIRAIGHQPNVLVIERSVWEVHPEGRYSGEKFRVAIGDESNLSRILSDGEPDPEGMKVIEVPIEFYDSFEKDTDQAIRDLAGYSTVGITPFISRREKIKEAIDEREHAFSVETWEMGYPARINWLKLAKLNSDGSWTPNLNPTYPRHIHLDLSKSKDATGFSVCHVSRYIPVVKQGSNEHELLPEITVDFMLKMRAPRSGEINYAAIRQLIYEFSKHGFFIKLVSADQFQCFTGDTKIKLLDGSSVSLKDLADKYKDRPMDDIWVYSFDGRRIVPGRAYNPRMTAFKKIVEVTLDNGAKVRCTHDHKWMMRDGSWKIACELKNGDSLMPLYTRISDGSGRQGLVGYEQVYQPMVKSKNPWELTHRMVGRFLWNAIRGKVIHHDGPCMSGCCGRMKFCKTNNNPNHLHLLAPDDHVKLHVELIRKAHVKIRERLKSDKEFSERAKRNGLNLYRKYGSQDWVIQKRKKAQKKSFELRGYKCPNSKEASMKKSKRMREINASRSFEDHPRSKNYTKAWFFEQSKLCSSFTDLAKKNKVSRTTVGFYVKKIFGSAENAYRELWGKPLNHSVVSVTECGEDYVYDISVHDHQNFALDAGVFVHNSASILQTLEGQGYATKTVSVEVPGGPYETMKLALYENRLRFYNYPPLLNELKHLQKNLKTGKVDHTETSEKDLSDSIAANVHTLSQTKYGASIGEPISTISKIDGVISDESWVLDNPKTIVVSDGSSSEIAAAVRGSNFQMPFEVG